MFQIGISIMAVGLIAGGIYSLAGKEKPEKQTSPPVAIAMIVLGFAAIAFAFIVLPLLMPEL